MSNSWIGVAIITYGIYTLYRGATLEGIMYLAVGSGFGIMGILNHPKLSAYKNVLNIVSWICVIGGLLLFIAVLRQDAYSF